MHDLTLVSSALASSQVCPPSAVQNDNESQRTTVALAVTLPAGSKAELKLGFESELTSSMMGYYRSSWQHEGKTEYYALTQFEVCLSVTACTPMLSVPHYQPTSARRAFPCWDEPALKASFSVTMISRAGTTNLSNMPCATESTFTQNTVIDVPWFGEKLLSITNGQEWKVAKFEKTPPVCVMFLRIKFLFSSLPDVNVHRRFCQRNF